MFTKYQINLDNNLDNNLFNNLSNTIKFEKITNGRKGAILVNNNKIISIVRTTAKYNIPAQLFLPIHYDIIDKIKKTTDITNINFNNALIEIYNNDYKNMGEHSDQALDLADNSHICLFSCYNNPLSTNIRTLKLKNKITNELSEIQLNHNSIVIFSLETNSKHLHKIILDTSAHAYVHKTNNQFLSDEWLGITFRLSKTFIKFINEIPYFNNTNVILKIANSCETNLFYKNRSIENKSIDYIWTDINYTISQSDVINLV
jgi:hypothetical protein